LVSTLIGAHRWLDGRLLAGDILVFLAWFGMLYQPMNTFCQSAGLIQTSSAQLKRVVFEMADAASEVKDRPDARILEHVRGKWRSASSGSSIRPAKEGGRVAKIGP
jgi:ABC-type multidrug transport system fused ATPase/permease subunit